MFQHYISLRNVSVGGCWKLGGGSGMNRPQLQIGAGSCWISARPRTCHLSLTLTGRQEQTAGGQADSYEK